MARIAETAVLVPSTIAQQIFVVGSAIAGILGGIWLSNKLAGAGDVPIKPVAAATIISAIFTFGSALILTESLKKGYISGT